MKKFIYTIAILCGSSLLFSSAFGQDNVGVGKPAPLSHTGDLKGQVPPPIVPNEQQKINTQKAMDDFKANNPGYIYSPSNQNTQLNSNQQALPFSEDKVKDYETAKQEWVNQNPDAYKKLTNGGNQGVPVNDKTLAPAVVDPDMPVMKNTGNPEKDLQEYVKAKELYLQNHPDSK